MLSAAKHLDAHRDRPFATLSVTRKGLPIQLRAIYALMPSRPRHMESWTCVLGWCISDAQIYPRFYPLWGIAFSHVFEYYYS